MFDLKALNEYIKDMYYHKESILYNKQESNNIYLHCDKINIMKKYTFYFKYKVLGFDSDQFGNFSLIAPNMVVANEYFKRLYAPGSIDRCVPIESIQPILDVYSITESTTLS